MHSNDAQLLVLTALADGEKHGYAINTAIKELTGARLGPGSLYGALARLEARRLIESSASRRPEGPAARRPDHGSRPGGASRRARADDPCRPGRTAGLAAGAGVNATALLVALYPPPVRERWGDGLSREIASGGPRAWPDTIVGAVSMWAHPSEWPERAPGRLAASFSSKLAAAAMFVTLLLRAAGQPTARFAAASTIRSPARGRRSSSPGSCWPPRFRRAGRRSGACRSFSCRRWPPPRPPSRPCTCWRTAA